MPIKAKSIYWNNHIRENEADGLCETHDVASIYVSRNRKQETGQKTGTERDMGLEGLEGFRKLAMSTPPSIYYAYRIAY